MGVVGAQPPGSCAVIDGMAEDRTAPAGNDASDPFLLDAARAGDRDAFLALVARYQSSLLRAAWLYVSEDTDADDLVRRTWHAAIVQPGQTDCPPSVKPWLYRAMVNQVRRSDSNDGVRVPFAATTLLSNDPYEGAVDGDRLKPASDPVEPLHWTAFPTPWGDVTQLAPELERALATLSPAQREVITLRDVLGWEAEDVSDALSISETNQRELLHRARATVRNRLEEHVTR